MTATELLRKYHVPAPRYTSYPTVPHWETAPPEVEWIHLLRQAVACSAQSGTGASLYLHIPFCENLCTFCGCNTRITKNHAVGLPYIEVLHKEWVLYRERLSLSKPLGVSELHLGGGTPTFLTERELEALLSPILNEVNVQAGSEFSLEVDPRVTSKPQLALLKQLGFGRVSMGIQDFDIKVQMTVNRAQPYELVERCVSDARELGYSSINFDLIYGLPFQTEASIRDTFAKVARLRPDRVTFYAYTPVPWIRSSQRKFTDDDLPPPALKFSLYELGRTCLAEQGYVEVGMDHFALPSSPLWQAMEAKSLHRNFMGYAPKSTLPLIGLGVSAISDAWTAFVQNEKSLEAYRARVHDHKLPVIRGHVLTNEDQSLRRHILNLLTVFKTAWSPESDPACETLAGVAHRLRELSLDGLVDVNESSVEILARGRPFIRNIAMAFDARLARKVPHISLFSKSS